MKYKQKKKTTTKEDKNIALLLHNFLHQKVMFRHFGSRASVHIAVAWEDQRFHSNSLHFSHSYLRFYY